MYSHPIVCQAAAPLLKVCMDLLPPLTLLKADSVILFPPFLINAPQSKEIVYLLVISSSLCNSQGNDFVFVFPEQWLIYSRYTIQFLQMNTYMLICA